MTVRRALHLCLSPPKRLSWPMATSKRFRCAIRGGLLSAFSAPGAGTEARVERKIDPGHRLAPRDEAIGVPARFAAEGGAGREAPQTSPDWNCWSALRAVRSTVPEPSSKGIALATMPLSYRQLKPIHGPFLGT